MEEQELNSQSKKRRKTNGSKEDSILNEPISAFRAAEKRYKLYKKITTDFSDVIDFSNLDSNNKENSSRINEISPGIFTIVGKEGRFKKKERNDPSRILFH